VINHLSKLISLSSISFSKSSGPGGQNVNKRSTKATLTITPSSIPEADEGLLSRLREIASKKGYLKSNGDIQISSQEARTQDENKKRVFAKLRKLLLLASKPPKPRLKTKPTKASKEKRLLLKRLNSEKKQNRRSLKHDN
jgi:ribosome-associated protein